MESTVTSITDTLRKIEAARKKLAEDVSVENAARSSTTRTRNELNGLLKEYTKQMKAFTEHPDFRETDWQPARSYPMAGDGT